jgi:hypothetical protein
MKKTLAACLLFTVAALANGFQNNSGQAQYRSAEGRYSVLFPQEPALSSLQTAIEGGEKLTRYRAKASDSDSTYMVEYFDLLPDMTYSFDKGRDSILDAVKGTLVSEEVISLEGHTGRDLKISIKLEGYEVLTRVRFYEIEGRIYTLKHGFLKSSDSPTMTEKTDKFFDSFKATPRK